MHKSKTRSELSRVNCSYLDYFWRMREILKFSIFFELSIHTYTHHSHTCIDCGSSCPNLIRGCANLILHVTYLLGVSCMYQSLQDLTSYIWDAQTFFLEEPKIKSPLYSINFILLIFIFSLFWTLFAETLHVFSI